MNTKGKVYQVIFLRHKFFLHINFDCPQCEEVPVAEIKPCYSSDPRHSSDNARYLTHWATTELPSHSFFWGGGSFWGRTLGIWRIPDRGLNWNCSRWHIPQPQQHQAWATSVTHTTAHSNTGSLTQWVRPEIEPTSSWILVGLITRWATMRTPKIL